MKDKKLSNEDKALKVLERMENGESERAACEAEEINRVTFRSAALKAKAVDQYARALEGLAADQVEKLEIAIEDMRTGKIDARMARVEIDARKWFASKFLPRRYGDKIDLTTAGDKIDNQPLKHMATEELQALLEQSIRNNKAS